MIAHTNDCPVTWGASVDCVAGHPCPRAAYTIPQVQASGGYDVIYADPAWQYADRTCNGAAEKHYSTMTIEEICRLPVQYIAAKDCALFLWATYPLLPEALRVIEAWSFTYKSIAFQWVKYRDNGRAFYGTGRWTRGNSEPCLIATRGKPKRQHLGISQLVETWDVDDHILRAQPTQHSVKPTEVRDRIAQLMGDTARIELNARTRAEGWDAWGDELPGGPDVILTDRDYQLLRTP